jgi:deoxyguanosine kinase
VLDSTNGTIIAERSIQSDKQIFALNGYKQQLFNELEFALYNNYYDWLGNVRLTNSASG